MRKITSKYKEEKKKKWRGLIIGLILMAIMLFSILGYSFQSKNDENTKEKINYNGFEFIKQNDFWITNTENFQFIFIYNPEQVEEINSKLNNLNDYSNKPLYIFSENSEAELEIYKNLFYQNQIIQRMQYACLEEEKCDENLPIKNCEDNFIVIKEGNSSEIIQEDNCIFITGKKENLTKLTDEFLFKIIGIQ